MEGVPFHDGNIHDLIESRYVDVRNNGNHSLQMHSSLVRRLSQERELELAKHKEALDFAKAAQYLAPSNSEVAERLEHVKRDLAADRRVIVMLHKMVQDLREKILIMMRKWRLTLKHRYQVMKSMTSSPIYYKEV
ncbi:uncharacterized protein LOC110751930 [Prunus avium]|uniref:Uncharacterized protein LOC110751930 n=1 Tax=Prunus avium TaxID=42229 RepID=A0A6P5RYE2_PRUAV|nr:uncharacterized protein LOC110751930 [Prunus avium]